MYNCNVSFNKGQPIKLPNKYYPIEYLEHQLDDDEHGKVEGRLYVDLAEKSPG